MEPDGEQRQLVGGAVLDFLDRFEESRGAAPATSPPADAALIEQLLAPPSDEGVAIEPLLRLLDQAVDTGFDTSSPGFLSYIPTGGLYTSSLGSFLGAGTNQYTGGSHASPGAVAIEQSVIDWMISLFGLPEGSAGVLFSGGSIANLTAVVAARSRLGEDFDDGVLYTSVRSHHSIEKAARIAGIRSDRVRLVPTDAQLRLDVGYLSEAIRADVDDGLRPMMVVGTAGTTDTGTIDPLPEISEIAGSAEAWFHVDAAYGGFFQLTERGRDRLEGILRADSITVDAHKSLFLPFGVGGLLVRDTKSLIDAHEGRGSYMQDVEGQELPHYFALGPELTRPNRGLAVWLPLHLHGIARFRDELDRMLDLAEWAADEIGKMPEVELLCDPDLSVVAFSSIEGDEASKRIVDHLNSSRDVYVSSTTIDDRLIVRLAFLSHRTTEAIAARAVALVRESLASEEGF
jgi:aromatic-L-amino-acid decarboxylase